MTRLLLLSICLLCSINTFAFELITEKVIDNIYALVGDTGPRTEENQAVLSLLNLRCSALECGRSAPSLGVWPEDELAHHLLARVCLQRLR